MFKKYFFVLLSVVMMLFIAERVYAEDYGLSKTAGKMGYSQSDPYAYADMVISAGLSLIGLVFLGMMLYGGLRWMTARGEESYTTKAKTAIEAGVIGFVVIAIAYGLTRYIFMAMGVK